MRFWPIILMAVLAGCTPASKKLAESLTDVQRSIMSARESVQAARTGVERVREGKDTPEPIKASLTPVLTHLDDASEHMGDVADAADKAQLASAGMKDKQNPWVEPLKTAMVVIGMGIVLVIVWKSGAFLIIRPIFRRIGARFKKKPKPEQVAEAEPDAPPNPP